MASSAQAGPASRPVRWWQYPYTVWAMACFLLLVLPLGSLGYAFLSLSPARGRERRMFYANNALAALWGILCGVRYRVLNGHFQHTVDAFVLTPTHTATPDMLVVSHALRRGTRFLVKRELRRVPLLGFMFARMGVFVDRKDAASRKQARASMRALAREGVSVCIFPEGTRNTSGAPLGPFYDGAFATAIDARIPILPLVLYGGPEMMPNGQWWMRPGTLTARFLAPEPTEGLRPEDVEGLKQRVRQRMLAAVLAGPQGPAPGPGAAP